MSKNRPNRHIFVNRVEDMPGNTSKMPQPQLTPLIERMNLNQNSPVLDTDGKVQNDSDQDEI